MHKIDNNKKHINCITFCVWQVPPVDQLFPLSYYRDMQETIKNCVLHYRKEAGLTQEELALRTGVTRQTIIAIEKGSYVPSVLLALKIAKQFNQSIEKLFSVTYEK